MTVRTTPRCLAKPSTARCKGMSDGTLEDWLRRIETNPERIELGLERVAAVHARMALPRPARQVITIAGTNGKGSTAALIEAIARAAGWRVGVYTSPHLLRYHERVRIDGVEATDARLIAAFQAVEAARGDTPLTYFETGTLAALWAFAREPLDLVVLEVGLGGRLDAVNVIDPDVAVITTVDLDHQDWLGHDLDSIGYEKAGIARAHVPLIIGDDDPPSSVLRHAYAIGAVAIRAGSDFLFAAEGEGWSWREPGYALHLPLPALPAPVQMRNAAVAIAAVRALKRSISKSAYATGVAAATLPGRLQSFVCNGIEVRVDIAHNPQAAAALATWLERRWDGGEVHAVYAALADKAAADVAHALRAQVRHWHLAGSLATGVRGQGAQALLARLAGTCAEHAPCYPDVAGALHAALSAALPGDLVLVFGSVHAAAEAVRVLTKAAVGAH